MFSLGTDEILYAWRHNRDMIMNRLIHKSPADYSCRRMLSWLYIRRYWFDVLILHACNTLNDNQFKIGEDLSNIRD